MFQDSGRRSEGALDHGGDVGKRKRITVAEVDAAGTVWNLGMLFHEGRDPLGRTGIDRQIVLLALPR